MEFHKKYLFWRMDFSEPLRIPDFRGLETVETVETYAIIVVYINIWIYNYLLMKATNIYSNYEFPDSL